jgi:hypothetical protein
MKAWMATMAHPNMCGALQYVRFAVLLALLELFTRKRSIVVELVRALVAVFCNHIGKA